MNRLLSVAVLGFAFILGSCDDASAPKGRDGVVTVRAYVDNDASGTFNTGDTPLPDFEVSLSRDGQAVATATTDDEGTASTELSPGTYRLAVVGGAPVGAALLTNPSPTAVVNFRGDSTRVDFRYAFFPGSVSGRLFIDDGATPGVFDATDTRAPGISVFLRRNVGGTARDTIATTVTDSAGVYLFSLVAPGTYFVEFQNPGGLDFGASGAVRLVTVTGQAVTAENAIVTGSLLSPIAQARARAVGSRVTVRGNVTARPGSFTSGTNGVNSEIWIQDASGGIAVFFVPTADSLTYAIGDLLQVTGTRTDFAGQRQIANPNLAISELGGSTVRSPKRLTGAQVNSFVDDGLLVVVDSIQIAGVGTGTATSFNVTGTTRDGQTVTLRITGPTATQTNTGLTRADFVVGQYYHVTGVLTQNNNVAQIKPRSRSDVVAATVPPPPQAGVRFSEIHYDNDLTDVDEFIEIAGPAGTDLTGWQIVLYNGNTPAAAVVYNTVTLSGVIPATCGVRGVVVQSYPPNGIQNGGAVGTTTNPDGMALVNAAGVVVELLSYEGVFVASAGPAAGMTSVNIGVSQSGTDPIGVTLQRLPAGTWVGPIATTRGTCNDL